jgi:hypothetical protein
MNLVKQHWDRVRENIDSIDVYSLEDTLKKLKADNFYKSLNGKASNRTLLKKDLKLYKSIYKYTKCLEDKFKEQKSYVSNYNFVKRVLFLVEHNLDLESLRCDCGKKIGWTPYCRHCPEPKKNQLNKPHKESTKLKMRLSTLKYIKSLKGQLAPRYNKDSISLIEEFGKENGFSFMHAENGGEYFIRELGYFLDAYDPLNNVVLEIDEKHHFDKEGTLKERDIERQKQIQILLGCKFIRIKYDRISTK